MVLEIGQLLLFPTTMAPLFMVGAAFRLAFALGWFLVGAQQRSMRARARIPRSVQTPRSTSRFFTSPPNSSLSSSVLDRSPSSSMAATLEAAAEVSQLLDAFVDRHLWHAYGVPVTQEWLDDLNRSLNTNYTLRFMKEFVREHIRLAFEELGNPWDEGHP